MTGAPPDHHPLSGAQAGIWMAQQLHPDRAIFRIGELMRITGPLDPALFETALRRAFAETDNLHLRFVEDDDGRVWQYVQPPDRWSLAGVDVSTDPDPDDAVDRWIRADLAGHIDLDAGRLFSFALFRAAPDVHLWYHGYHHIVTDGIGCGLFVRRVAAHYGALVAGYPEPPPGYGSVRRLLTADATYRASETFAADRRYWLSRLDGWSTPLRLADHEVPPGDGFLRRDARLTGWVTDGLSALARKASTSDARVFVGAAAAYLGRSAGVDDVVVGLPLTGRTDEVTRGTPGLAVNVLPLRLSLAGAPTTGQFLDRVADAVRGAVRHQRYRGEDLYRDLLSRPGRSQSFGPLVNVMLFDYDLRFGECRTVTTNVSLRHVEDLAITVYDRADGAGVRVDVEANPDRYLDDTVTALHEGFLAYLERFAGTSPDAPLPTARPVAQAEGVSSLTE
ncbi:MAG: condensation domain-containing protein [Actinocatenispora sp.]